MMDTTPEGYREAGRLHALALRAAADGDEDRETWAYDRLHRHLGLENYKYSHGKSLGDREGDQSTRLEK